MECRNLRQKSSQPRKEDLGKKTVSCNEIDEKPFNLEKDGKKKTGSLDKVTKKKTYQPRE